MRLRVHVVWAVVVLLAVAVSWVGYDSVERTQADAAREQANVLGVACVQMSGQWRQNTRGQFECTNGTDPAARLPKEGDAP